MDRKPADSLAESDKDIKLKLANAFQTISKGLGEIRQNWNSAESAVPDGLLDELGGNSSDIQALQHILFSPSSGLIRGPWLRIGDAFVCGCMCPRQVNSLEQYDAKDYSLTLFISEFLGILDNSQQELLVFLQKRRLELSNWPPAFADEILAIQLLSWPQAKAMLDIVNNAWAASTAHDDPITASFSMFLLSAINTMRCIGRTINSTGYRTYSLSQYPELRQMYSNWNVFFSIGTVITLTGFTSIKMKTNNFENFESDGDGNTESVTLMFPHAEGVSGSGGDEPGASTLIIAPPAQFVITRAAMSRKNLIIFLTQAENPSLHYCQNQMVAMSNEELVDRGRRCDCHPDNAKEVFRLFKLAADRGSIEAQYLVGMCFKNGKGVGKDEVQAFNCFKRAAETVCCDAMYELANCFNSGSGTRTCRMSGRLWMEAAAFLGHAKAQYCMGRHFDNEYHTPNDWAAAYYWYSEAAKQIPGDPDVAMSLGKCFEFGRGVGKNLKEALQWYTVAAVAGVSRAQSIVAKFHEQRKQMQEAAKFYLLAAKQGGSQAQYRIAQLLEKGDGVPKDMPEAVKWYSRAAGSGYIDAQCRLGQILKYGIDGTEKDVNSAVAWFEKASEADDPMGHYEYALCFLDGFLRYSDQAEELLNKAAENGVVEARLKLAHLWMERAADSGFAEAQFQLGCCLKYQQAAEAQKWLKLAARQGHVAAQTELASLGIQE